MDDSEIYRYAIMNQALELPTQNVDSEHAIPRITQILSRAGLQVIQSFDLQTARASRIRCRCPHHGTDQCDCQMVVLLIYGLEAAPSTLVAHGHDGKTYLSLVDDPQQRPDSSLSDLIRQELLANPLA